MSHPKEVAIEAVGTQHAVSEVNTYQKSSDNRHCINIVLE